MLRSLLRRNGELRYLMNAFHRIVAHRGSEWEQPENTLLALRSSICAGARYVEFDVQMSADGVPVLMHDDTLSRTTGETARVMDKSAAELGRISAHYPERFGETYRGETIPTLGQTVGLVNDTPGVVAFVDCKPESLGHFGTQIFIDRIVEEMNAAVFNWVFISSVPKAIEYVRHQYGKASGWILRAHDESVRAKAYRLRPDYLVCNIKRINNLLHGLWPGPWQWMLYGADDLMNLESLLQTGASLVETGRFGELLEIMRVHA